MGLLEVEFSPIIKKVLGQEPQKIEAFIRSLILIIDKQKTMFDKVRWTKEAEEIAEKAIDDLILFMKEQNTKTE